MPKLNIPVEFNVILFIKHFLNAILPSVVRENPPVYGGLNKLMTNSPSSGHVL